MIYIYIYTHAINFSQPHPILMPLAILAYHQKLFSSSWDHGTRRLVTALDTPGGLSVQKWGFDKFDAQDVSGLESHSCSRVPIILPECFPEFPFENAIIQMIGLRKTIQ